MLPLLLTLNFKLHTTSKYQNSTDNETASTTNETTQTHTEVAEQIIKMAFIVKLCFALNPVC
jgi:hypothetical protein